MVPNRFSYLHHNLKWFFMTFDIELVFTGIIRQKCGNNFDSNFI